MNLSGVKGDNQTAGFKHLKNTGGKFVFKVLVKKDPTVYIIKIGKEEFLIRTNKKFEVGKTYTSEELLQPKLDKSSTFLEKINLREETSNLIPFQFLLQEIILNQLSRNNTSLVEQIEKLLRNFNKNRLKTARLLAILEDKGIKADINSLNMISEITEESFSGESGKRDPEKREKKEKDVIKEEVKIQCNNASFEPSVLGLFNNIKAENQNWILIPIKLYNSPRPLTGWIKLLIEENNRLTRLIIDIDRKEGNLAFLLQEPLGKNARWSLIVQGTKQPKSWRREFSQLKEKLQNLGVKYDDIKEEVQYFDGFDCYDPGNYKSVDTRV